MRRSSPRILDLAEPRVGARVRGRGRRRPPADRHPGQQRRGDDAAALRDRRRLRAPVRHQPPRPLRAHRAAARRRSPPATALAGGHRLQPRAPARASSTSTTCSPSASYSPRGAYQQSKFANAVFGLELDRRLRAAGLPVISVLAHPGYSATNLQTTGTDRFLITAVLRGRQPRCSPRAPTGARCRSSTRRPRPGSRAASSSAPTASSRRAARRPRSSPSAAPATRRRRGGCGRSPRSSPASRYLDWRERAGSARALGRGRPAGAGRRARRAATGTRSSSAAATTGSPPPPTWPAPASGCWCSSGASGSAARARSSARSPTSASSSAPAPTWSDCSIRW